MEILKWSNKYSIDIQLLYQSEATKKKCQNFDSISKSFDVDFDRCLFFLKN